jgi:redox-sensitive bicupin YhaK (pirin superfamily)
MDPDDAFHVAQSTSTAGIEGPRRRFILAYSMKSVPMHRGPEEGAMPAVTADTLTLPRLDVPVAGPDGTPLRDRPVRSVTTAPSGFEGEGFPVRRAFAGVPLSELDPFVHMDQMGAVDYAPYEPRGTDWHPHRGFETVTYILDGEFVHQDSHGGGGSITDGATQWMTAGQGILHIETPPEHLVVSGGLFHGVQLWVNLPARSKMVAPAYQNLDADLVTLVSSADGGALVRLIAGDVAGHRGPGSTHTPITVAHATVSPGARAVLPWNPGFNALAYALAGSGSVGAERAPVATGQLAVLGAGDTITLTAGDRESLDVLLLGGEPIGEPVVQYGPFVMNTRAEVQQAFEDFQRGALGTVPADGIHPYRGHRH